MKEVELSVAQQVMAEEKLKDLGWRKSGLSGFFRALTGGAMGQRRPRRGKKGTELPELLNAARAISTMEASSPQLTDSHAEPRLQIDRKFLAPVGRFDHADLGERREDDPRGGS